MTPVMKRQQSAPTPSVAPPLPPEDESSSLTQRPRAASSSAASSFDSNASTLDHRETQLEFDEETGEYVRTLVHPDDTAVMRRFSKAMSAESDNSFARRNEDDFDYQPPAPTIANGLPHAPPPQPVTPAASAAQDSRPVSLNPEVLLDQFSQRLFGLTQEPTPLEAHLRQRVRPALTLMQKIYKFAMPETIWVLLILLGTGMSMFAWCIDEVTEVFVDWRGALAKLPPSVPESKPSDYEKWAQSLDVSTACVFLKSPPYERLESGPR